MSPCFLKKPAFCPSSEKQFSHLPASPPAMRNLSCATATQFKSTRSANAGTPSLRLNLIISRPPRHAAMQFDTLVAHTIPFCSWLGSCLSGGFKSIVYGFDKGKRADFYRRQNSGPGGRLWIKLTQLRRQQWRLFANNVRGLLCNHDNRRIDVASNQVRKHRRVDHAQAVNTDHTQLGIHHGRLVGNGPHPTRPRRMMRGHRGLARVCLKLRVGRDIGARADFRGDKRRELTAASQIAEDPDAATEFLPVVLCREQGLGNARMRERIGG